MNTILANLPAVLAQAAEGAKPFNPQSLIMIGLMFVMFYVILIRPQRKRQKELADKIKSLKTGMKVVTIGGMHGLVANVKDTSVTLKLADNVKVEFEKTAIANIITKADEKAAVAKSEPAKEEAKA